MSVDSPHPLYVEYEPKWRRCRDTKNGVDAVKRAGTTYLPPLDGHVDDPGAYAAYKLRAMFYPATERTIEGLTGLVLRKPPQVTVPDPVEQDLEDLTLSGQSWESLLLEVLDETIGLGRLGILIEYPKAADEATLPDTARPYWTLYRAEQIVNWETGTIVGPDGVERTGVTRVVLHEAVLESDPADRFTSKSVEQYRVLELDAGAYTVTVFRRRDQVSGAAVVAGAERWVPIETIRPERRGKALTAIPFVFVGARHTRAFPDKPPLLDMIDVNLSHYRSSADLEHGRHWTALPTAWVTGYSGGTPLKIGSSTAWALVNPASSVGMLEFTGAGLRALSEALEHKERLMAILGARLLEGQPMRGETAEAVRLRHAGEAATLTSIVCAIEEALTLACRWHAWWQGADDAFTTDTIVVGLNRDFFEAQMSFETANTAMTMWQSGGISYETYFWLLQKGEWMRPDATLAQEKALIALEAARAEPEPEPEPAPTEEEPEGEAEAPPSAIPPEFREQQRKVQRR
jgi:Domain of unknown function (DUF4055)